MSATRRHVHELLVALKDLRGLTSAAFRVIAKHRLEDELSREAYAEEATGVHAVGAGARADTVIAMMSAEGF